MGKNTQRQRRGNSGRVSKRDRKFGTHGHERNSGLVYDRAVEKDRKARSVSKPVSPMTAIAPGQIVWGFVPYEEPAVVVLNCGHTHGWRPKDDAEDKSLPKPGHLYYCWKGNCQTDDVRVTKRTITEVTVGKMRPCLVRTVNADHLEVWSLQSNHYGKASKVGYLIEDYGSVGLYRPTVVVPRVTIVDRSTVTKVLGTLKDSDFEAIKAIPLITDPPAYTE